MALEFLDTFAGSAGTALVGHAPELGATWLGDAAHMPAGVDFRLTGDGYVYGAAAGNLIVAPGTFAGSTHQIVAPFRFRTNLGSDHASGIDLFSPADGSNDCRFMWSDGNWTLSNPGEPAGTAAFAMPAPGTVIWARITCVVGTSITCEVSADGGTTWTTLFGGPLARTNTTYPFSPGFSADGASSATTGVHVGKLAIGSPAVVGPATATVTGPTSLTVGTASASYAITLNAPAVNAVVFTPSASGFSATPTPSTVTIAPGGTAGTFTLTASTAGSGSVTATATGITVTARSGVTASTSGGSTVTTVTVSPATATVAGGASQAFTATVTGTGSPSQAVTWSAGSGTFSGATYTAPAAPSSSPLTVTVTATSVQDASKSGTATVTVPAASPGGDGPLVAGVATAGVATAGTASAAATDASGGVTPYSYQWYRSTASGTLGSAVPGQTTRVLADAGLAPSTAYRYTLRYTDGAAGTADSNQVTVTTSAATPAPPASAATATTKADLGAGGLAGTAGVTVYRADRTVFLARSTAGIAPLPGTTTYFKDFAGSAGANYFAVWDVGDGDPTHTTVDEVNPVVAANLLGVLSTADHDGTFRAGTSATTLNFDANDPIANGLPPGTLAAPQQVRMVRGPGIGQVATVVSVSGASGARSGAVSTDTPLAPAPDATTDYAWLGIPPGGGSVDTAGVVSGVTAALPTSTIGSVANLSGVALSRGTVSASPAPTTTTFRATGSSLNTLTGGYPAAPMAVFWQTGALAGFKYAISGHTTSGSNHDFVTAAMVQAPAAGDTFVIG